MNKEDNSNHIVIEVLNNNGDLKLTKIRNPQAIWQNNNYPDEYVLKDVDYINIFQLIQENKQLKEQVDRLIKKEYEKVFTDIFDEYKKSETNFYENIKEEIEINKGDSNE